jgi:AraC family chitin signaling transcriptional activator
LKATLLKTFLFFLLSTQINAQELLPFVKNYNKANYQGDNQTWNVAQGSDDAMYFANNHYLLRYDGVKWEKNMLPNKTIIRSIYVVDDKIYSAPIKNLGIGFANMGR